MVRLPYTPRPGQARLAEAVHRTQQEGGHLLVEAATGTGKTVAALAASLESAAHDGRRLVYATRTNSQQAQVLREHRELRRAGVQTGLLVPFMGRRQYCPFLSQDPRYRDGTPEELGRLCRDAKERARRQAASGAGGEAVEGACPYYVRLLGDGPGPVAALLEAGVEDAGGLAQRVTDAGSCTYEALKLLLPEARAVVVPSVFLVDERLRRTLLEWLGTGPDGCHLVVDEAHHLPGAARDHHSPRLGLATLRRARREAREHGDPVLAGRIAASRLMDALARIQHRLATQHIPDGGPGDEPPEALLPPGAWDEAVLAELGMPSPTLARVALELEQLGEAVREARRARGRLPRSHLGAVGAFLSFWGAPRDAPYVHLVTGGEAPAVEAVLLDAAAVLGWLEEFWSTVHMSGTLRPLEEHQALCGLPGRTRRLVLESPFDPARLRVCGVRGVHRRHRAVQEDPGLVARQQEAARALIRAWTGRIGCFFPSHAILRDYLEEGFLHGIEASLHVERRGMSAAALDRLVAAFRSDPAPRVLLLGVLGGRLTEGVDFPGDALERMVLLGVPYPRPTARLQALLDHHERRHGAGWQYAVHNPTGRVLRQTVGRLIRGPEDSGTAVVLDERVARFCAFLPGLRMVDDAAAAAEPPPQEAEGFTTAARL